MTRHPSASSDVTQDLPGDLLPNDRVINALFVEDSEFDRKRTIRVCEEAGLNIEFTTINGLAELRTVLDSERFDLAIVDYRLPDSDGLEIVRRIRNHPLQVSAAILMLTGQGDLDLALEAMKAGCSDYLDKSKLSASVLRRAASNALEKSLLHQELMRARGLNDKLAQIVQAFAKDTAGEMKPILLSMMRQTRAQMNAPMKGRPKGSVEMDAQCRKLWAVVESMEDTAARM